MDRLWRTEQAVAAAAKPSDVTGSTDLLASFKLGGLAVFALQALHVDYNDPSHQKQFDWIGKCKWPAACQQLYRHGPAPQPGQPPAPSKWSIAEVAAWQPHHYSWKEVGRGDIKEAFTLQPGAAVLPPEERGTPVGPLRMDAPADGDLGFVVPPDDGAPRRGRGRGRGKRGRAGAEEPAAPPVTGKRQRAG